MAITTTNGKLAIMEMDDYWEPGLPLSPGALGTDDKQQLLWGFPDILWSSGTTKGRMCLLGVGCWLLWILIS